MVSSVPWNWGHSSPDSWLARRRARRRGHPDEFRCAVRVVAGVVPDEADRWSYRPSAVDPLRFDDIITLTHGPGTTLRLRIVSEAIAARGDGLRPNDLVWEAIEVDHAARVEVATAPDDAAHFERW